MSYSDINGAPGSTVTQILQQPVSCAINNLFAGDQAQLGEMQQIRDLEIAKYPAGQWLIEILDRHSADLALLVASDKGGLAQTAWDLLTKAAQIARQGRLRRHHRRGCHESPRAGCRQAAAVYA